MIRSFKHGGLRRLWERGDPSRLHPSYRGRIGKILTALDAAEHPRDLTAMARLHPLHGDRTGTWAVRVSANWRLVFRFSAGDARDIDLIDYH